MHSSKVTDRKSGYKNSEPGGRKVEILIHLHLPLSSIFLLALYFLPTTSNHLAAAELPGVGKDDITVEIKDSILTLKGQGKANQNMQEKNIYRQERCLGAFQRSLNLQQNIQPKLITATVMDGVIEIEIPKP